MVSLCSKKNFKRFSIVVMTLFVVILQGACMPHASGDYASSIENQFIDSEFNGTGTSAPLNSDDVPHLDYRDLYSRLYSRPNIPKNMGIEPLDFNIGELSEFNIINEHHSSSAKTIFFLCSASPHLYLWVEKGTSCSLDDGLAVTSVFENDIYLPLRKIFGEEPSPGIDLDEHIYILYTSKVGDNVGGYFSSADEYHPLANPSSNAHETIVINSKTPLGSKEFFHVLAHEFQHMIHWNYDPNEVDFIDEGFSELAADIAGYPPVYNESFFENGRKLSLINWGAASVDKPEIYYHGSYLFAQYLADSFGFDFIKTLVSEPGNGLFGLESALSKHNIMSSTTDSLLTSDELIWSWQLFLVRQQLESDRLIQVDGFLSSPGDTFSNSLEQYALSVVGVDPINDLSVSIQGDLEAVVLPAHPHSGDYSLWTRGGNMSNPMATKLFDFDGIDSPILSYWIWYDTEPVYDLVYVSISSDGGDSWSALNKAPCDNKGELDCLGYSGSSNGWVYKEFDLSEFSGQRVLLRFEYVTDPHTLGSGVMIDDVFVSGSETTSFEHGDNSWNLSGFSVSKYSKDQQYRLASVCGSGQSVLIYDHGIIANGEEEIIPPRDCSDIYIFLTPIIDTITANSAHFSLSDNPNL